MRIFPVDAARFGAWVCVALVPVGWLVLATAKAASKKSTRGSKIKAVKEVGCQEEFGNRSQRMDELLTNPMNEPGVGFHRRILYRIRIEKSLLGSPRYKSYFNNPNDGRDSFIHLLTLRMGFLPLMRKHKQWEQHQYLELLNSSKGL